MLLTVGSCVHYFLFFSCNYVVDTQAYYWRGCISSRISNSELPIPLKSAGLPIPIQSRSIQMRCTILYLANRWMDFKMLLTPNSFFHLRRVLLLPFGWIPQFIAQFWCICPILCTPLSILLIILQIRAIARQQERKKRRFGEKSFPS